MKASKEALKTATEAALTSYVVTTGQDPQALAMPHVALAFCYFSAHFGLDLLTEDQVGELMDFVLDHEEALFDRQRPAASWRRRRCWVGSSAPLR